MKIDGEKYNNVVVDFFYKLYVFFFYLKLYRNFNCLMIIFLNFFGEGWYGLNSVNLYMFVY